MLTPLEVKHGPNYNKKHEEEERKAKDDAMWSKFRAGMLKKMEVKQYDEFVPDVSPKKSPGSKSRSGSFKKGFTSSFKSKRDNSPLRRESQKSIDSNSRVRRAVTVATPVVASPVSFAPK